MFKFLSWSTAATNYYTPIDLYEVMNKRLIKKMMEVEHK